MDPSIQAQDGELPSIVPGPQDDGWTLAVVLVFTYQKLVENHHVYWGKVWTIAIFKGQLMEKRSNFLEIVDLSMTNGDFPAFFCMFTTG